VRVIATNSAGEELIAGVSEGIGWKMRGEGDDKASTAKQRTTSQRPRANCLTALRGEGIPSS
jgi:hypothetical protein